MQLIEKIRKEFKKKYAVLLKHRIAFNFIEKQLVITPCMCWDLKTECLSTLTFIEYKTCLLCYNIDVYISFPKNFGIVIVTFLFLNESFFKGS